MMFEYDTNIKICRLYGRSFFAILHLIENTDRHLQAPRRNNMQ